MFDKEKAIAEWRAKLASTGSLFEGDLDELESHLRDELEGLEEVDLRGEAAFDTAVKRLGEVATIGVEFAKVNPLLVWRTALFWLAMGCFITLTAAPLFEFGSFGVIQAALSLHLSMPFAKAIVWIYTLGVPVAFYMLFFRSMAKHVGKPFAFLQTPIARVPFVLFGAVSMLAAILLPRMLFGILEWNSEIVYSPKCLCWRPSTNIYRLYESSQNARQVLGSLIIVSACALAMLLRQRAIRQAAVATSRAAADAPLFWLATGTFIALCRQGLGEIVRQLGLVVSGLLQLSSEQINPLMWILAFGCPLFLGTSAYAFLRLGSVSPRAILSRPGFIAAMVVPCAATVIPLTVAKQTWTGGKGTDMDQLMDFTVASATARGFVRGDNAAAGKAFLESMTANCITSLIIAVVLGTIIVRLEQSAHDTTARA